VTVGCIIKGCTHNAEVDLLHLTCIGPCIVIYFYDKTDQMYQCIKFILFWVDTMFRTVFHSIIGDRGSTGYGAVLQIGRSLVRFQLVSVDFSLTYNPSDRTMALGSTHPLTEMSTRTISWGVKAAGA